MNKEFTYQISGEYSEDFTLENTKKTIEGKTYTWVQTGCGKHVKLTRSKSPICYICLQDNQLKLMQEKGLVVLDRIDAKHYNVIMPCKHEKIIEGNLASYMTYCSKCRDEKILAKCPTGTFISGFSSKNQWVHLDLPCGHSTKRKTYAPDNVVCLECRASNKIELLNKISATEVEYSRYRLDCGHTTGDVAWQGLDTYKCPSCERDKIHDRARDFGLEPTGSYDFSSKSHEFMLKCGHNKYLRTTSIKAGVVCPICVEDHYNKPCDMYFLIGFCEDGFRFLKVGIANDTNARLKTYQARGVNAWALLASIGFETKRQAVKVEKEFHKSHVEKRILPEEMKKYLKEGFTECYPVSVFTESSSLIEELCKKYGYSVHFKKENRDV